MRSLIDAALADQERRLIATPARALVNVKGHSRRGMLRRCNGCNAAIPRGHHEALCATCRAKP